VEPPRIWYIIAEDDPGHAEAIRRAFESFDASIFVQIVRTLREFREMVSQFAPDLAILDMNLPDGKALELLRYPPESNAFPVLIMTSYGTEQLAVDALKAGAMDYVIKSAEAFLNMPHRAGRVLREWNLLTEHQTAQQELMLYRDRLEELVEERTAEVKKKTVLLEAINKVILNAISCETEEELGSTFLEVARDLTGSEAGHFGIINAEGRFDTISVSGPDGAYSESLRQPESVLKNMEIRGVNLGTMHEGISRIVNGKDAFLQHPDHRDTPGEHLEIHSFLGVPWHHGGDVIGMVGLANKPGGYTGEDVEQIEALSIAMVQVFLYKRAEDTIKGLNESLRKRTEELEFMYKELDAFTSAVSHDLRAPLRVISLYSQRMLNECGDGLDERSLHYMDVLTREAQRLSELIDGLLNLSRVTTTEFHRRAVDLTLVAGDTLEYLRHQDPERQVDAAVQQGMLTMGDPLLIRQVIENLLGNAWKFTRNRQIASIEFGKSENEHGAVFFISDNGAGFDPSYAERLFVPFQRLHSAAEFPGHGIGLSTVERISRRHGGKLWFESEVDKGTTVFFTFA